MTTPSKYGSPELQSLILEKLTEADCIAADLANIRYKQSSGPAKDNQARAVKLEQQWSEAARLGGWRL